MRTGDNIRSIALVSKLTGSVDLGDIVMSTAVTRYVRQRFPSSKIVLIAQAQEIARYGDRFHTRHSWIDELHPCPPLTGRWSTEWLRFYRRIRTLGLDLCVAIHGGLPGWVMFLAGISRRIGLEPANRRLARLLTHRITVPIDGIHGIHWTDFAAAYVAALGGPRDFNVRDLVPYLRYEREELDLATDSSSPLIAMHIGGAMHWNRRWPRESYLQIGIRLIREIGASLVLVGGDEEKPEITWLSERLKHFCPEGRITDFAGCSINRVLNVYSRADLYIGNDSGLMHLAVAMGVPVIAVFGPSDYRYLGPDRVDAKHQVVTIDSPCAREGCRLGCDAPFDMDAPAYPACMKALDVSSVWTAVAKALSLEGVARGR